MRESFIAFVEKNGRIERLLSANTKTVGAQQALSIVGMVWLGGMRTYCYFACSDSSRDYDVSTAHVNTKINPVLSDVSCWLVWFAEMNSECVSNHAEKNTTPRSWRSPSYNVKTFANTNRIE